MSLWQKIIKSLIEGIVNSGDKQIFSGNKIDITHIENLQINIEGEHGATKKILTINFNELNKELQELIEKNLPQVLEEGVPVLEEGVRQTGEDYIKTSKQKDFKESIGFFDGKIPKEDLKILKASYYLKHLHNQKKSTRETKEGIVKVHGEKGKSISNLCTAGYFETYIRPLYEAMQETLDFKQEKFLKVYEDIIKNSPFALFVPPNATAPRIQKMILDKIGMMGKYGISTLNIHGIGQPKVKAIRIAIENIEETGGITFKQSMTLEGNVIVVKLTDIKH